MRIVLVAKHVETGDLTFADGARELVELLGRSPDGAYLINVVFQKAGPTGYQYTQYRWGEAIVTERDIAITGPFGKPPGADS